MVVQRWYSCGANRGGRCRGCDGEVQRCRGQRRRCRGGAEVYEVEEVVQMQRWWRGVNVLQRCNGCGAEVVQV